MLRLSEEAPTLIGIAKLYGSPLKVLQGQFLMDSSLKMISGLAGACQGVCEHRWSM